MPEDELRGSATEPGFDQSLTQLYPLAFRDRHRHIHFPFDASVAPYGAVAAAEPEAILMTIEKHEEQLRSEGYAPGSGYLHGLVRQYQPTWALARQWAGLEQETEMLQEIGRL